MQNKRRCYKIGGFLIGYEGPAFIEKDHLRAFRTEEKGTDIRFEFIPTKKTSIPAIPCVHREEYIHIFEDENERVRIIYDQKKEHIIMKDICSDGSYHMVEYDPEYMTYWDTNMMMKVFELPYQLLTKNALFLHSSYIEWKGKAILFTAPKQTGKSTQAALWKEHRNARILNGDRTLIRKKEGKWMAYGSPYCGTSGICENESIPIGAVVILEQADKNSVRPASNIEKIISMLDGGSYPAWNTKSLMRATDIINDMIKDIPFYKLSCRPDSGAVEALEEVLW